MRLSQEKNWSNRKLHFQGKEKKVKKEREEERRRVKSESVADVLAQGHRLSVREDDRQRDDGVQVLCAVTAKKKIKKKNEKHVEL